MIPKIIHYCWFGGNPKPDIIERCIASWKKYCPDYEIIEWNETNFDISQHSFMMEAYEQKKWAFVSDVARLIVLYNYGGIYMDTDVELKKECPFDRYIERDGLFAFEHERAVQTGLCCGCSKGSKLIYDMISAYDGMHFHKDKMVVNTVINMPIIRAQTGVKLDGTNQIINNIEFLSIDMFADFAVHYGTRTWDKSQANYTLSRKPYRDTALKRFLKDPRKFSFIEKHFGEGIVLKIYTFIVYDLLEMGPVYFVKRFFEKQ